MMNLFSALELGKNSLMAQQQVFQIIGHNIANVNTEGYTRQVAIMESVAPSTLGERESGRGVTMAQIFASRSAFLQDQIVDKQQLLGKYETLKSALDPVQALFDESKGLGISSQLTAFFNKWHEVANQPTSTAARDSLVSQAQTMTYNLRNIYTRLTDQQEIQNNRISALVDEINGLGREIAALNDKIAASINIGQPANDLLDQRDLKLKNLSEKIGVNVYFNSNNNSATVEIAGRPFVVNTEINPLSLQRNTANYNYYDILMPGSATPINSDIQNGQIQALLQARDVYVPQYKDSLDNLALGLVTQVNSAHLNGFALDGTTTGLNFFAVTAGGGTVTTAGTTVTFSASITGVLNVGDMINIGGQNHTIVGITDATHVVTDAAFNPAVAAPTAWNYFTRRNGAATIAVNPAIVADSSLVAASAQVNPGPPPSGAPGNNAVALQIAGLMDAGYTVDSNGDGVFDYGTYHDYLHDFFARVGNDVSLSNAELSSNKSILTYLENKRDEIAGVSLDEEAANLMQYEKSYQAVAQFVGIVNRLTDVLMQIGR